MASQSLYRKYRSQTFADIVGQERVTRTLRNAILAKRLSHAYLLCGPRGVGKTSAARVLAKAVNCHSSVDGEPCNTCAICKAISEGRCLDVIEIDAASNRGIDEIRDLREKVNFSPSDADFKFYILDEAHMLTTEAFNALLKTLEEPPAHAVFVLITTESHRLPATILSRCQRFDLQRITLPDMVARLRYVCEQEQIEIQDSALELIGRLATGSLRDAESLLDKLVSFCGEQISLSDVHMVVGMTGSTAARELANSLLVGNMRVGLQLISRMAAEGVDLRQFCREVVEYLRAVLVLKVGGGADLLDVTGEALAEMQQATEKTSAEFLLKAIRLFTNAEASQRSSVFVQLPIELAFVEALLPAEPFATNPATESKASSPGVKSERMAAPTRSAEPRTAPAASPSPAMPSPPQPEEPAALEAAVVEEANQLSDEAPRIELPADEGVASESASATELVAVGDGERDLSRTWRAVIDQCGQVNKSIQAILRDGELVRLESGIAEVEFAHEFHQGRIEDPKNGELVCTILNDVVGAKVTLKCSLRAKNKKQSGNSPMDDPLVKAVIEYGGKIKKVEVAPDAGVAQGAGVAHDIGKEE